MSNCIGKYLVRWSCWNDTIVNDSDIFHSSGNSLELSKLLTTEILSSKFLQTHFIISKIRQLLLENILWLIKSSTSTFVVPVPPTRLSTAGDRAFSVAAARTWNSLPTSLTTLSSLASFRRQLKTELFVRSFPDLDSSVHDRIWQLLY